MAYDPTYGAEFGGVSTVNPQASGNYQQFIDASFQNALRNLKPIFGEQEAAYTQQMINQGLPVGGEAHDKSLNALYDSFNDTYANAAFDAMGFGLGAQNQDFEQALARSQLANSLQQAQWGNETAYSLGEMEAQAAAQALEEQARQFDQSLIWDQSQFGQELDFAKQQFGDQLGFDYTQLFGDLGLQYDILGSDLYKFDSGLDFDYWRDQNQFDYLTDRANQSDLQWFADQERQDYYDDQGEQRYWDSLLMAMLGFTPAPGTPVFDPTGAYGASLGAQASANNNFNSFWSSMAQAAASAGGGG